MVSVIVPAYNVERYIGECIKSIIQQSYSELEIIVVDDGSTDSTSKILNEIAKTDARIQVLTQSNQGPSSARNTALDVASGEWITFVDADDVLLPRAIENMVGLAHFKDVDIVECVFRDEESQSTKKHESKSKMYIIESEKALSNILYQKPGFNNSVSGKLFKASIFSGLRFSSGKIYEDLEITWAIYSKASKILHYERPVYFYRNTPGSLLHIFNDRRFNVLSVTKDIENKARVINKNIFWAAKSRRFNANFNILGLLAAEEMMKAHKVIADECWEIIKRYRFKLLFNSKVRIKTKLGILVSYLGRTATIKLLKKHYG